MKFYPGSQKLLDNATPELNSEFPELHVYWLKEGIPQKPDSAIVVDEGLEPEEVIEAVNSHKLSHLVQKNKGHFEKSLFSAGRLIHAKANYFQPEYCFPEGAALRSLAVNFQGSQDKDEMKRKSLEFIQDIQSSAVVAAADAIIEELYMNAVIDAPREAKKKGTTIQSTTSELFLVQTDEWLQISCTDPYGSLEVIKFLERMQEVYIKGAGAAINLENTGGAGLGCVILFEQCTSLILGVLPGQKTKVTCLIPLGISNRQRAQMKKSIHWFEL